MKTNNFVQVENFRLIDEKCDLKNSKYLIIFVCCFCFSFFLASYSDFFCLLLGLSPSLCFFHPLLFYYDFILISPWIFVWVSLSFCYSLYPLLGLNPNLQVCLLYYYFTFYILSIIYSSRILCLSSCLSSCHIPVVLS